MNKLYLKYAPSSAEYQVLLTASDGNKDLGSVDLTPLINTLAKTPVTQLYSTLLREIATQVNVNIADYEQLEFDLSLTNRPPSAMALYQVLSHLVFAGVVDRQTLSLNVTKSA